MGVSTAGLDLKQKNVMKVKQGKEHMKKVERN